MAIISGPGGLAVSAAEACGSAGLRLAELSSHTTSNLVTFVPPTGTSLRNPIDLGFTSALNVEIFIQTVLTAAADPGVDAVVVIGRGLNPESNQLYTESMIQVHEDMHKPLIMVSIPEFERDLAKKFCEAGIPFFETAERAMSTYARVRRYQIWRQQRDF